MINYILFLFFLYLAIIVWNIITVKKIDFKVITRGFTYK